MPIVFKLKQPDDYTFRAEIYCPTTKTLYMFWGFFKKEDPLSLLH